MNELTTTNEELFAAIKTIVVQARKVAYRSNNTILLNMYWEIGKLIVQDEQGGKAKAAYGKSVLKNLSKQLTLEFGKGFDERNLNNIRAFYLSFPIWNAVRTELSWTHYRIISRIEAEGLRMQYVNYTIEGNWDTRTLQRNITSQYIGRIIDSNPKQSPSANEIVKDPYLIEFIASSVGASFTEKKLEDALIQHLQSFLMELGKGFAFVARQQHIVTDTADFFIDLVFYNYYLKCFVLIDLKTHKLTHEAIGQMDMYVRMYNDLKKSQDDNPTIGIILCTEKDETIVKYSVLAENEQLFASRYRLYLPTEEELQALIEKDKVHWEIEQQQNEKAQ
jgi:predicted nuclease of restriction endonuclease-like (RecB) superfamily